MRRQNIGVFIVAPGEIVTVEVEAVEVGNFETFTVDEELLDPLPGVSPPTYQFPVTVDVCFAHFAHVSGFFPEGTPDTARYEVFVSGSEGGERLRSHVIRKTHDLDSRDIEFRCRQEGVNCDE
ncbi:MAG TPA: hypothetical protein VF064_07650 [Pyrinomonadaceae bacterium]